eukprot:jgi/Mesen1/2636/ME000166S01751
MDPSYHSQSHTQSQSQDPGQKRAASRSHWSSLFTCDHLLLLAALVLLGLALSAIPAVSAVTAVSAGPELAKQGDKDLRNRTEAMVMASNDDVVVTGGVMADTSEPAEPEFGSMDSMLQWAIEHADPKELKDGAEEARQLSPEEIALKRAHLKDVMEAMRMPSDAEMMAVAIADVRNFSRIAEEALLHALQELSLLVEPIDNANNLHKLGGIEALEGALASESARVRTEVAWVLGKAAQNNPTVQSQYVEAGLLPKLMAMVASSSLDEAVKALYAVSGTTRGHVAAQELFFRTGGIAMLARVMNAPPSTSDDTRLKKKAVFLLGDLAESQVAAQRSPPRWDVGGDVSGPEPASWQVKEELADEKLLTSVLGLLTEGSDLDLQEKALATLRSLVAVGPSVHQSLVDRCHVHRVLEVMRIRLAKLAKEEGGDLSEFAEDIEVLRRGIAEKLQMSSWSGATDDHAS